MKTQRRQVNAGSSSDLCREQLTVGWRTLPCLSALTAAAAAAVAKVATATALTSTTKRQKLTQIQLNTTLIASS